MGLFDDVGKLLSGFRSPPITLPGLPPASGTGFQSIPTPQTYPKQTAKVVVTDPGNSLNEFLAGFISQGKLAPGVDLAADLTKIAVFGAAETGIGVLEEFSESAAFIMGGLLSQVSEVMLAPNLRDLEYQANFSNPNKNLPIATHLAALFRGLATQEDVLALFQKEGYNSDNANILIGTAKQLLGLSDLISLYFRGYIKTGDDFVTRAKKLGYDETELDAALAAGTPRLGVGEAVTMFRRGVSVGNTGDPFQEIRDLGYDQDRIDAIEAISYEIPNIINQKDFVVRGVDDPDTVSKFQLDYGLTPQFLEEAAKLGYTEADATKMWRSDWQIPSFFIVQRLYGAGKIKEQDFRDLLTFMRFTPYWQDLLATQLKPTITQADVKTQYKYGLVSAAELPAALVAVGTDPELAKTLTTLWVASVKQEASNAVDDGVTSAEKIKGQTLGLVKDAYKDGVLNKADATAALKTVGYTDEIITLSLSIADYETEQAFIKELWQQQKELITAGAVDPNDAITTMTTAGATADQLALYSAEITRLLTHKPVVPTRAEFESAFKKGIISSQDLVNAYSLLGYGSDYWSMLLQIAGVDTTTANSLTAQ